MRKLLTEHENGNYKVKIYSDGTKIRTSEDDFFSPSFPESIDVNISNKCWGECPFCYQNCTSTGSVADLKDPEVEIVLNSLKPGMEVAVNFNSDPGTVLGPNFNCLCDFLKICKEKGVIANATTNLKSLSFNRISAIKKLQDEGLLHGIGVSVSSIYLFKEFQRAVAVYSQLQNVVFHVIVGLFDNDIYDMFSVLKDLGGDGVTMRILFLGYKNLRRSPLAREYKHKYTKEINSNFIWLKNHIKTIMEEMDVVGFDNLAIKQLDMRNVVSVGEWDRDYMGDDGEFTMFIDLVTKRYAASSHHTPTPFEGKDIQRMFQRVRRTWETAKAVNAMNGK